MGAQDKSVQLKLSLLKLAGEIGSVSRACEMMNFSRDSYYRFKGQYQQGGEAALKSVNRKKPLLKNRVSSKVEIAVRDLALNHPAYGQQKASAILHEKNITVSPSGVRSIWMRNDLETKNKRLTAIRTLALQDGLIPDHDQLVAFQATKRGRKPLALETGGPGYFCFHGLKKLEHVNGIGPVFLQIFQDCYSRYTFTCLSTGKDALTIKPFLANKVFPWFDNQDTPIQNIISDRTLAFCGQDKNNNYQKYLKDLGIGHNFRASRERAPDEPWAEFFQTMQDDFFRFVLPSRTDWTLEALAVASDEWVSHFNKTRPNSFRFCYGKTPYNTFKTTRSALLAASHTGKLTHSPPRRSSG